MLYFCTFFECRGDNVTEEYKIIETIYQDLKAKTPDTARYNEAHLLFNKYIKTPYARKFLKLCEETQLEETDYKYRSILEFNYFRLHHFYFNIDSCNYYLNRLRNISYHANDFRNYFTAYKSILDMFTSRGDYDFVLIQTRQMLIEAQMVESQWGAIFAHLTEATVHRFRKKYSRAIECYKKAIALAEIDVVTKSSIMTQMANCYLKLEDYDNAYNLLVQNEILLDNISKKFPQLDARYRSKIFELQVYFAKYYYQIEELENMNKYLTLAKERYSKNIFPSYLMLYHELSAIYYDINNEPTKALVAINKALVFFKKDEQTYYLAQLVTQKGEYLVSLDLYAEAFSAY